MIIEIASHIVGFVAGPVNLIKQVTAAGHSWNCEDRAQEFHFFATATEKRSPSAAQGE